MQLLGCKQEQLTLVAKLDFFNTRHIYPTRQSLVGKIMILQIVAWTTFLFTQIEIIINFFHIWKIYWKYRQFCFHKINCILLFNNIYHFYYRATLLKLQVAIVSKLVSYVRSHDYLPRAFVYMFVWLFTTRRRQEGSFTIRFHRPGQTDVKKRRKYLYQQTTITRFSYWAGLAARGSHARRRGERWRLEQDSNLQNWSAAKKKKAQELNKHGGIRWRKLQACIRACFFSSREKMGTWKIGLICFSKSFTISLVSIALISI